jgi:hypothetical protein
MKLAKTIGLSKYVGMVCCWNAKVEPGVMGSLVGAAFMQVRYTSNIIESTHLLKLVLIRNDEAISVS